MQGSEGAGQERLGAEMGNIVYTLYIYLHALFCHVCCVNFNCLLFMGQLPALDMVITWINPIMYGF